MIYILGGNSKFAKDIYIKDAIKLCRNQCDRKIDYSYETLKRILSKAKIVINTVGKVYGSKKELEESNVKVIERIVDSLKNNTKLIHISSISVYGKYHTKPIDENTPLNPDTYYAITKAKGEEIIKEKHKNSLIIRLGTLFGTQFPKFKYILKMLKLGIIFIYGNGENHIPFTYSPYAGRFISKILNKKGILNLTSPGYKQIEIVNKLKMLINPHAIEIKLSKNQLKLIGKIVHSHLFEEETIESLTSNRQFNTQKAIKWGFKHDITKAINDFVKASLKI